jgi:hypothetical protein
VEVAFDSVVPCCLAFKQFVLGEENYRSFLPSLCF